MSARQFPRQWRQPVTASLRRILQLRFQLRLIPGSAQWTASASLELRLASHVRCQVFLNSVAFADFPYFFAPRKVMANQYGWSGAARDVGTRSTPRLWGSGQCSEPAMWVSGSSHRPCSALGVYYLASRLFCSGIYSIFASLPPRSQVSPKQRAAMLSLLLFDRVAIFGSLADLTCRSPYCN